MARQCCLMHKKNCVATYEVCITKYTTQFIYFMHKTALACHIFTFNKHFDKENDCVYEPVIT